jgi:acetoin utilization deacetylase AcuC-like enzyme
MHKAGLIYSEKMLGHKAPQFHPECGERLTAIISALKNCDLWDKLINISPRKADFEDIALVHDKSYIERVKKTGAGYLDPDTYMSNNSLEAALYAAGSAIEAINKIKDGEIERAFCAVRPPGHHAEADRAMGFCIFNNISVGARYAQKNGYSKVFIIDFDVHHGNGTQHIFEEDDTVFYFSTHQYPHYPGTGAESERGRGKGEGYTYNVTMRAGSGDKDYLHVYHDILPGLIRNFNPDIVLVSAGYDIRQEDPLSAIHISDEGISSIVHNILTSTDKPVIFTLEGGYDLDALAESVKLTIEEMLNT